MGRSEKQFSIASTLPRCAWIAEWFGIPLDTMIEAVLHNQKLTPLSYDPCLYDELLTSASERLDVCLVRRRDIMDLLDRAIRQGMEEDLFVKLRVQDDQLDLANKQAARCDAARTSASDAADSFQTVPGGLTEGLSAAAKGFSAVATVDADADVLRQAALANKASALRTHHEKIVDLSKESGHPFNFEQRARRSWTLMVGDLEEIVGKLASFKSGVEGILKIQLPPLPAFRGYDEAKRPDADGTWPPDNALDALVLWAREASRVVERYVAREIEVTLQIPLVCNYSRDGISPPKRIKSGLEFAGAFNGPQDDGAGIFSFDIDETWFPSLKQVRVLGVGASIIYPGQSRYVDTTGKKASDLAGREIPSYEPRSVRVMIDLPERAKARGDVYDDQPERSLLLGGVNISAPILLSPPAIRNADPLGTWRVRVLRSVLWGGKDDYGEAYTRESLQDVMISVRVAGLVSKGAGRS